MAGKSPRAIPDDPNTKRGFLFFLDTYLVWRVPAFLFCLWVVLRWQDIPLPYFPKFNRDLLVIPAILAELYHILRRDKFSVVGFPAYIVVFPVSAVFFLLYDLTRLLLIPIRLFVILKRNTPSTCASSSARSSGWCPSSARTSIRAVCSPWARTFSPTWFSCTLSNG